MTEGKSKYYSDAQRRATAKYKEKAYKRVPFDVPNAFYNDMIKPAVDQAGTSLNKFLKEAVTEKIERMSVPDKFTLDIPQEELDVYAQAADERGMTLEEMIIEALKVFIKEY